MRKRNFNADFKTANNAIDANRPPLDSVWYHHPDGKQMQAVDFKIYRRFTHAPGIAKVELPERDAEVQIPEVQDTDAKQSIGVPPERLKEFESSFEYDFPDDYRDFLLKHNGGNVEDMVLLIPQLGDGVLLLSFFGLDKEHQTQNIEFWLNEESDDFDDSDLIPIGADQGGNLLLLDLSDDSIYYWDAMKFFPDSTEEANAYQVAESFSILQAELIPYHIWVEYQRFLDSER